jgi:hypothetical protein
VQALSSGTPIFDRHEPTMPGEPDGIAPDRVVLAALDDSSGNVSAAWRQLSKSGWQLTSLTSFRRRANRLISMHPNAPEGRRDRTRSGSPKRRHRDGCRGDVLVVAIDVHERTVIRSWVIPAPSRRGCGLHTSIREALTLRSNLMLDLSEYAAHPDGTR